MFCDSSHLLLAIAAQPGAVAAELLATAGWVAGPELWGAANAASRGSSTTGGRSRRELEAEADMLAAASSALSLADVDMAPDARVVLMAATAAARARGDRSVGTAAALLALLEAAEEARGRDRALLKREKEAAELWGKQSPRTAAAQRALAQEEQARRRRGGGENDDGDDDDDDPLPDTSPAERAARTLLKNERMLAVAPATLEALGGAAVVSGGPRVDWRELRERCASEPPEDGGAPARERSLDEWVGEMRAAEEQARAKQAAAGAGSAAGAAAAAAATTQQQQERRPQAPPPPARQQPAEEKELDMNDLSPEEDDIYN
jgi:hypothetical protein